MKEYPDKFKSRIVVKTGMDVLNLLNEFKTIIKDFDVSLKQR